MEIVRLLLSIVVMTVIGHSVLRLISGRESGAYYPLEKLALSYSIGLGAVAYGLLVFALAGISFDLWKILIPWAAVFLCSVIFVRKDRHLAPSEEKSAGPSWLPTLLLTVMGVQTASIFLRALVKPLESYDAIMNFGIKSKMFFMYNGFPMDPAALAGAGAGHMDYPLLIPLNETWIYKFLGSQNDNLVMILFPMIFLAFAAFFYSSLRRMFGRIQALIFTFLLCTVPQIVNFSTNGYGDVALTFMVTAAFIMLFRYFTERKRHLLVLSAVFSGMGFLTKNEGISFILADLFIMGLFLLQEKDKKRCLADFAVFYLLPLAIVAAPWVMVKHVLGVSNTDIEFSKLTSAKLLENAKQIPFILNKFQQEIFGPKKWNILWIVVVGFTVLRFRKTKERYVGLIGIFIVFNLIVYFASYMALTGKNLYFHVNTTISRLMMHFSGVSLFFLAFLVKDDIAALLSGRKAANGEKVVFLDRDGVINKDPFGWTPHSYVTRPKDFIILPGVTKAMKIFAEAGYRTVIISNQQGVGKGFFTQEDLISVNDRMVSQIEKGGGRVTGTYYCPHLTEQNCGCKKPKPGMFLKAQKELGIKSFDGKYFVGDTERDIQAGRAVGLKTILVLTGKSSREDAAKWEFKPDHICEDLVEAAKLVVEGRKVQGNVER
jgi:D-glycero-D-manno-heptose 1,7-bisphosphate phosphatase